MARAKADLAHVHGLLVDLYGLGMLTLNRVAGSGEGPGQGLRVRVRGSVSGLGVGLGHLGRGLEPG